MYRGLRTAYGAFNESNRWRASDEYDFLEACLPRLKIDIASKMWYDIAQACFLVCPRSQRSFHRCSKRPFRGNLGLQKMELNNLDEQDSRHLSGVSDALHCLTYLWFARYYLFLLSYSLYSDGERGTETRKWVWRDVHKVDMQCDIPASVLFERQIRYPKPLHPNFLILTIKASQLSLQEFQNVLVRCWGLFCKEMNAHISYSCWMGKSLSQETHGEPHRLLPRSYHQNSMQCRKWSIFLYHQVFLILENA